MCGWWGPLELDEHVLYDIKWSDGSLLYLLCKRCEGSGNWQHRSREHFRYCCGPKCFGPDDWFQCTYCGRCVYFGEDVPDNYFLNFVVNGDHGFELLCNRCF